ncbi:hypothetical protein NMY22_g6387 [Coprinellus aureogranulatus]|nr:hypothetical protein NMY22_g6387 [Coprinellus aureogranulatus]
MVRAGSCIFVLRLALATLGASGGGGKLVVGIHALVLNQGLSGLLTVDRLLGIVEQVPALARKPTELLLTVFDSVWNLLALEELRAEDDEGVGWSANGLTKRDGG